VNKQQKVSKGLRANAQSDRGSVLISTALLLVVMLGFAALAIDVGFFAHSRREAQNDADAMALAGVSQLPDEDAAADIAMDWGDKNNVEVSEVVSISFGITCEGVSVPDTITVRLARPQPTFLAGVLGVSSVNLNVCATARIGNAAAGTNLMPFGFHEIDPYPSADPNPEDVCYFYATGGMTENPNLWNETCVIKIPSPSEAWTSGHSGPVRLDEGGPSSNYDGACSPDSSGSSSYEQNIEEGSECAYGVGDEITPKPGGMTGPTCSAMADRLAGNSDTLADVFGTPNDAGVYMAIDRTSPRFTILPIVSVFGTGSSAEIEIVGFITVYINSACEGAGCNGTGSSPACVIITPVKSKIFLAGIDFAGGLTTNDNALHTIKLIN
jgi:hypothetical protein